MISVAEARKLAMAFPETIEMPHFERASFRTGKKKKIFMTMHEESQTVNIPLSPEDQATFSLDEAIKPVPNKWGLQGWTTIDLKKIKRSLFKDAMNCAYLRISKPAKG